MKRRTGALSLVLTVVAGSVRAQALPDVAVNAYPEPLRQPVAQAIEAIRTKPDDAARVGALAMLLHAWDQWATAAPLYARARALDRRYDWYYLGGLAEIRLAHYPDAADLLAEAVALDPTSVPARLNLADALFESGAIDRASRAYVALSSETAAAPHAHYGLGRALAARGEYASAVRELDLAVQLFPEFGAAWYTRGLALRNLGRLQDAQQSLAKAQEYGTRWPAVPDPLLDRVRALRNDAAAHMSRGIALERQGDLKAATAEYEAAVAANPRLAQAHVNLITLYGRQQLWAQAEAHYRDAVRVGSSLADAHYNYGVLLASQGRRAEAAEAFRSAVAANPQHAGAWNNLGLTLEAERRFADAERCYRRATDQAPANHMMRFNLVRMLLAQGKAREAIGELQVLLAADDPERARFLLGLATASIQAGDAEAGRKYASEARDLARARGQTDLAAAIEREMASLR